MFEQMPFSKKDSPVEGDERNSEGKYRFDKVARGVLMAAALSFPGEAGALDRSERFENESGVDQERIEEIFETIGLPHPEEFEGIDIRIPLVSQNGHYIIHLAQQHAGHGLIEETMEDRRITTGDQEKIYNAARKMSEAYPYMTYHGEGMFQNDDGDRWAIQKEAMQEAQRELVLLVKNEEEDSFVDVEAVYEKARHKLQGENEFTRSMMHKLVFTLQNALEKYNVDDSRYDKSFLESRNPFGKVTEYYYGGVQRAYYSGFVQSVRGCESKDILSRLAQQYETRGETDPVLAQEREDFVVNCLTDSLSMAPEPVTAISFGGLHDFTNEIKVFNDALGQMNGYIVLVPKR